MTYFLYHDDISSEVKFGDVVAIDTETMGLNINRDRLCLIQLSSGDGNAHLVQISKKSLEKEFDQYIDEYNSNVNNKKFNKVNSYNIWKFFSTEVWLRTIKGIY